MPELVVCVFPTGLCALQTALAKPIIQLLAKEHHTRQAVSLRPTVGQTLLEGISQSQPQPKIPAEMIKYMGRHVHAWHIAISMLEGHVVLFPNDMRCFDALCHLYRALAEEDMAFGLWHRRAVADDTRIALALGQHGFLVQAQLQFLELMGRGVSGGIHGATEAGSACSLPANCMRSHYSQRHATCYCCLLQGSPKMRWCSGTSSTWHAAWSSTSGIQWLSMPRSPTTAHCNLMQWCSFTTGKPSRV